jgi:hypothetical protein
MGYTVDCIFKKEEKEGRERKKEKMTAESFSKSPFPIILLFL